MLNFILDAIAAIVLYSIGGLATLWNIRRKYPDLFDELRRRSKDGNA